MEVEEHGSFLQRGRERESKREESRGLFFFPYCCFSPLCPDMTAEDVIISFLSPMHKHQSRNASESRKKKEVSLGTLKHHKSPDSMVKQ